MTLTLYIDMMSQPSRAVLLFCKENGIPHKVELVQIAKGENRSAKYKAINPLGKVPAIDDAGFKLTESHAILQYLATTRSVADHWYPKDPKARARVDEMLHWHHANLRAGSAGTVFPKALAPRLGLSVNQPLLEQAEKTLTLALKFLESVLKKQPFVAGSSVSIADLSLACELDMLRLIPYDLSAYPSIIVWMDRIKALANWKSVTAVLDKAAAAMAKSAASSKSALSAAPTAASGASYGRIDDSANSAKKVMRSAAVFDAIREKLSVDGADMVRDLGSVFRFELSSKDKGKPVTYSWVIDAKSGSGAVNEGDTETKADTTFVMSDDDFINLAGGKGNPKMMFMTGKLKIKGSAGRALKFSEVVLKKRAKEIKDVIAKLPPKAKL